MADMTETDTALDNETNAGDSERLRNVYDRAMRRFDDTAYPTMDNRTQSLLARRFITIPGAQWEGEWGEQFENAIKLEIDKVGRGVQKIERDYRENRIIPDFRPDGPNADEQTANMLDGLHRADSYRYKSQQARDNAFFEAVAGGMGAYRLTNELEDPRDKENDHQRVNPASIIVDADQTVFFDIGAKLYDKSDGRFAFIRSSYTRDAFGETFGEDRVCDFPEGVTWRIRDWFQPDTVFVAEYYEREDVDDKLWVLTHAVSGEERRLWASEMEDGALAEMKRDGFKATSQKRKRCRVHKYILSGAEVLEDCGHIAGEHIPIVPVYGRRYFVDGIERWKGYVQDKMDSQRTYNTMVSRLVELNSLAPREVPIFDPEQIDPVLAQEWADANWKRSPYLLAHSLRQPDGTIVSAGPIGKIEPPQVPQVQAALIQIASGDLTEDMQDADEVKANTSAEAMDLAATRVDAKSGIYLDNNRQSVQREGEIYLSMASEVYVEEGREVETMDEDGGDGSEILAQSFTDPDTGGNRIINDLTTGRYKVIVSVTEATATRRDKTVKAMLNMAEVATAAQDMELAQAAIITAGLNTDGEGADDFQAWLRKRALGMGLVKPTEEEAAAMEQAAAAQEPDPLAKVAEAQAQDFQASAAKKQAEVGETQANTELKRAQTIKTLAEAAGNDDQAPQGASVPAPMPQLPKPVGKIQPGDTPRFLRA